LSVRPTKPRPAPTRSARATKAKEAPAPPKRAFAPKAVFVSPKAEPKPGPWAANPGAGSVNTPGPWAITGPGLWTAGEPAAVAAASAVAPPQARPLLDLAAASDSVTSRIRQSVPSDSASVDPALAKANGWHAAFLASALSSVGPGNPKPVQSAFESVADTLADLGRVLDGPGAEATRPDRPDGGVLDPADVPLTESDAVRLGVQALKAKFPNAEVRIVATRAGQGILDRAIAPSEILLELERTRPDGKKVVNHFQVDQPALQNSATGQGLIQRSVPAQRAFLGGLADDGNVIAGFLRDEKPALDRVLVRVDTDPAGAPQAIQTLITNIPGVEKFFAYERAHAQELAAPVVSAYAQAVGNQGEPLTGEPLVSTLGFALGAIPNNPALQGAADQSVSAPFFVGDVRQAVVRVSAQVEAAAKDARARGGTGSVSVVPVTVSPTEGVSAIVPLFKVLGPNGDSQFVDHHGRRYPSFKNWEQSNTLPRGLMTFPREGTLTDPPALETRNTPAVVDTFAERARNVAVTGAEVTLGAAAVVGIGAAMASGLGEVGLVGTGVLGVATTAASLTGSAAALGGLVLLGDTATQLGDLALHHEDLNPISSPRARSHWLMLGATAASALTAGSSSAALKATRFGLNSAVGIDGLAQLSRNWSELSWDQRAYQLLLNSYFVKGAAGELVRSKAPQLALAGARAGLEGVREAGAKVRDAVALRLQKPSAALSESAAALEALERAYQNALSLNDRRAAATARRKYEAEANRHVQLLEQENFQKTRHGEPPRAVPQVQAGGVERLAMDRVWGKVSEALSKDVPKTMAGVGAQLGKLGFAPVGSTNGAIQVFRKGAVQITVRALSAFKKIGKSGFAIEIQQGQRARPALARSGGALVEGVPISHEYWHLMERSYQQVSEQIRKGAQGAGLPTTREGLWAQRDRGRSRANLAQRAQVARAVQARVTRAHALMDALDAKGKLPDRILLYTEGHDGAGKGSTSKAIEAALVRKGYEIKRVAFKGPTEAQRALHWLDRFREQLPPAEAGKRVAVIWDRGPVGDIAYGKQDLAAITAKANELNAFFSGAEANGVKVLGYNLGVSNVQRASVFGKRLAMAEEAARVVEQLSKALPAKPTPAQLAKFEAAKASLGRVQAALGVADLKAFDSNTRVVSRVNQFGQQLTHIRLIDGSYRSGAKIDVVDGFVQELERMSSAAQTQAHQTPVAP
jgi:polyphosphate kinase 2 (PPK2 family)